jgi:CheY-like chemotaxis protein/PAS domain-containing protein
MSETKVAPIPSSTGPSSIGSSSTGPSSTGPSSTGPSSTGPSSTGPSSTGPSSIGTVEPSERPRILYLGGARDSWGDLRKRFGDEVEIDEVGSPVKALARMAHKRYDALYVDAEYFSKAVEVGRLLQNDRLLQEMPDGIMLLDNQNTILWGNGRLKEWSHCDQVVGENFYQVLGSPEILGPDFCPFHTALATGQRSASTLRCSDNRYYRLHAAPLLEEDAKIPPDGSSDKVKIPEHLIVTIHDISDEVMQQQKLAAIHQASTELADLTTDEVANLTVAERIELLKDNILHCTRDVLQLSVVEIRMLDPSTGVLESLLSTGMGPDAEGRKLLLGSKGYGVTGFVAATGKSYLCENTTEDPLYLEGSKGARSSLTVPLLLHEQVIGTLNVESSEPNAFTESDLQFLELFARNVATALNTLELLAAEKASTAAASVDAIHSAVAKPVDEILNDVVNVMERYIGHEPNVVERLQRILKNTRDIKRVIQKVGQTMAPSKALLSCALETRPLIAGKRILVIDADETVRRAAHELLERYHCVVETAHDGHEATYMLRNLETDDPYDVIIADVRLPDMNGYELLLKLREISEQVPLALMTGFGYDPGHTILKARQAGVKTILYKPFRLDQMVTTIEKLVAGKQEKDT